MPTAVRPLVTALNAHGRYACRAPDAHVDHVVIGAGVVGLAVASALAHRWPEKTTYVVERHAHAGQETSSRNSEVVHAGLYYPADSLKTRLCTRGRDLLYARAQRPGSRIGVKPIGKLVVGRSAADSAYLARLHAHCEALGNVPTTLLSGAEARAREPDLDPAIACALYSPRTGIVRADDLLTALASDLDTLPDGTTPDAQVVYGTSLVRLDPDPSGWLLQTRTHDAAPGDATDSIHARVVVNTSGLNAPRVLNALVAHMHGAASAYIPMYFAKGSYASYRGPGVEHVAHLLYPTPPQGDAPPSLGSTYDR